jgi:holliday junction DNA helicase RuvA
MELRDQLDVIPAAGGFPEVAGTSPTEGAERAQALADAVSALVALGYRPVDATRMARVADDGVAGAEDIIRNALRAASGR